MVEIARVKRRILNLEGHPTQMRRHEPRTRDLPMLDMAEPLRIAISLPVQRKSGASRQAEDLAGDARLG